SPGNKEGGLTTIYEKSLGAIAKAGSTAMVDVVQYAEPVTKKGFVVMDTPGYDPVSMTGIVAGGADVCVFTTGRGSVFGCKPAPCVKVATNTPLYNHMLGDTDNNARRIHPRASATWTPTPAASSKGPRSRRSATRSSRRYWRWRAESAPRAS